MRAYGFHDLLADREHWIERRHRFLEYHRDAGAADFLHAACRGGGEFLASKLHAAGGDMSRRLRQQTHDCERCDRFPAAGLADNAEDFALVDVKTDIFDGGDFSPSGLKHSGQPAEFEQPHCWILKRGSSTSRSPSPSRLRPITVIISAMPGMVMIQGASTMYWRPSAMML